MYLSATVPGKIVEVLLSKAPNGNASAVGSKTGTPTPAPLPASTNAPTIRTGAGDDKTIEEMTVTTTNLPSPSAVGPQTVSLPQGASLISTLPTWAMPLGIGIAAVTLFAAIMKHGGKSARRAPHRRTARR